MRESSQFLWSHLLVLLTESLTNMGVTAIVSNYQVTDRFKYSLIGSIGLLEQIHGSDAFRCNAFSRYIYVLKHIIKVPWKLMNWTQYFRV